jgi:prevent-host-death family protein
VHTDSSGASATPEPEAELPLSALRIDIAEVANRVVYYKERVVLTRHGRRIAAIMPIEDLETLKELERREPGRSRKPTRRPRVA